MNETMQRTLADYHRQIASGIAEIRQHCSLPSPDIAGLGGARLRLSRVSTARSHYVCEVILPRLREGTDDTLRTDLNNMQRAINSKRMASSEHVTTWSSKTISENWNGYCRAAHGILAMMEEQIDRERRVLGERLAYLGI